MSNWIEGAALYAVGGDIVGMGATVRARFRPLDEKADRNLIRAFLDAQTAEAVYFVTGTDVPVANELEVVSRKRYDYGNRLLEAGVFTSKYDVRSTWILTEDTWEAGA